MKSQKEIWINGKFLSSPVTGVQRFSWGMCEELAIRGYSLKILVNIDREFTPHFGELVHVGKRAGVYWEQIELPLFLKKNGSPQLINFANAAPMSYGNNFVVIHDAAVFEPHPDWFSIQFRAWYKILLPRLAKTATIATVSEFSASRLSFFLNVPKNEIPVLYNGMYLSSVPSAEQQKFKKPYILAVGSHNPRKGLDLLIDSFLGNEELVQNYELVIVGTHSKHFKKFNKAAHKAINWLENVTDNDLMNIYSDASVVAVPSRYEGFGIPILEALHFNKKVLANRIEPFQEIFGSTINYTDFSITDKAGEDLLSLLKNLELTSASDDKEYHQNGVKTPYLLDKCTFKSSCATLEHYL